MRHRSVAAVLSSSLLLLSLLSTGCGVISPSVQAERSISLTAIHDPEESLDIQIVNGRIDVAIDEALTMVLIEAVLVGGGATQEEAEDRVARADVRVLHDESNRTLTIEPIFPAPGRGNDAATIVVRMPQPMDARLISVNGTIRASGLSGDLRATAANGTITAENLAGALHARTTNGTITAYAIAGAVDAQTVNGRIELERAGGSIRAVTANGAVTIESAGEGPLEVRTTNGSVRMTLGPSISGTLSIRTGNGSITLNDPASRLIHSEVDRRRATARFGEDGPESSITTTNGSVTVNVQ